MANYLRVWRSGGTYFFTVCLLRRHGNDLLIRHIDALRKAIVQTRQNHAFEINAWVVLPEHQHCVITLPAGDDDFALRWRLIKRRFPEAIPNTEYRNEVRIRRGERGVWQRRYWEHLIRNEQDYQAHVDYVHFNPVKHQLVRRVSEWPYSTFHRWLEAGVYPSNWGAGGVSSSLEYDD
ncbi:MAG: transposase [Steroidobacter sp.]